MVLYENGYYAYILQLFFSFTDASAADETQSSSYELTQSACIVSINCISPRAGNCLIKIADQTETIVPINETYNFQDLTPNIIYWFNITFVELSFVMENNNFSIQGELICINPKLHN